ncbi:MAG: peptide-methionine (R)-S-oxide reductase MsrB [Nitrosarchaeum sp.]|jgi:peptide-methionine (R)-S-oxide reductase|uniref:peptide-methionine (R)-S-oxide reductase MsrB n=1 Tax=Nitrosarchaeum sp. TaxID=2026886 RepID=UPI002DF182A2|nr:peptide-methionine (R)-S-oxide reductase MsrB [Nitrosarchaeum sp.]MEC4848145.1 peptide-methionine (R)-S-oxide reductase MsrB [Nitrosarchaeum sp.]
MADKIEKTPQEWKEVLTPNQFEVCINKGTEPPFSGKYYKNKEKGTYKCVCCGEPLFTSETKYDSGSGWPSFWQPLSDEKIEYISDNAYGMIRTEVNCKKCGAHLGHVFDDGPKPTNLRYCINSISLNLEKKDE